MLDHPTLAEGATWLRMVHSEKRVRKAGAKWDLSDNALTALYVDISVKAKLHRAPPQPHPALVSFLDTETELAAGVLREGLEGRRRAALLTLAEWENLPRYDQSVQLERIPFMIAKIDAALSALDEVAPILKPAAWPMPRLTWRHYAVDLAKHFVRRMRECNPGHSIGIGAEGPVAAFVRAVVPFITGEEPTQNNVAVFLKEHAAQILRG
jgi:hypothetical protein